VSAVDASPRFEGAAAHDRSSFAGDEENSHKVNQSAAERTAEMIRQQGKQQSDTNGRDNREKHSISSNSHRTTTEQGEQFFTTSSHDDTSMQQLPTIIISSSTTFSSLSSGSENFSLPPPPPSSTAATSAQPLSINSQPISMQHGSNNSSHHGQQGDTNIKHNQATNKFPKNTTSVCSAVVPSTLFRHHI
jgi:hypothetical protein